MKGLIASLVRPNNDLENDYARQYVRYDSGANVVQLDGYFTVEWLRAIADHVERFRVAKIEP